MELLLVMLLTSMVLMMVGRLTAQTFGSLRFLQTKAQTLQAASMGLDRLANELREAIDVTSAGSGTLIFNKVNYAAPLCAGNNPTDPPSTWARNYGSIGQVGTVQYKLSGTVLTRKATFKGTSQTTDVATNVNLFQVDAAPTIGGITVGKNVFLVTLSIDEGRKVESFQTVVTVPGVDP